MNRFVTALAITSTLLIAQGCSSSVKTGGTSNNRTATVVFSQPVQPDTTLSIEMKGVNTLGIDNTWNYRVYGKMVGINEEIPLGTARIPTYR